MVTFIMQLDVGLTILPANHFQLTLAFDTGSIGWSTFWQAINTKQVLTIAQMVLALPLDVQVVS